MSKTERVALDRTPSPAYRMLDMHGIVVLTASMQKDVELLLEDCEHGDLSPLEKDVLVPRVKAIKGLLREIQEFARGHVRESLLRVSFGRKKKGGRK